MSQHEKNRVIADTGWGIKPDDQPSNAAEAAHLAVSTYRYDPADMDVLKKILLAQRRGFNTANRVRVERDRTLIYDINGDAFTVEGLGFGDIHLLELLERLGAAFDPQDLKGIAPRTETHREYPLSRAWAWGAERSGG